jgi:rhodanese-related sulfurtransferase
MSVRDEILALEEQLRQAELGPDPAFFERVLADDAVLDGQLAKAKVVAAHQPGGPAKFTSVEMSDFELHEHGSAVVVTCTGVYQAAKATHTLKFMRIWLKKADSWQIIAASVFEQKSA